MEEKINPFDDEPRKINPSMLKGEYIVVPQKWRLAPAEGEKKIEVDEPSFEGVADCPVCKAERSLTVIAFHRRIKKNEYKEEAVHCHCKECDLVGNVTEDLGNCEALADPNFHFPKALCVDFSFTAGWILAGTYVTADDGLTKRVNYPYYEGV